MKTITLLLFLSASIGHANDNIFDNMDEKTSVTTGVYKLSIKEKKALMAWLNSSEKEIIKKEKVKNMGFQNSGSDKKSINSNLVGETTGWNGKTVFTLANGQKWKQADKTRFSIPNKSNPAITIKPKSFGSWLLKIDGYNRGVKVKRIK